MRPELFGTDGIRARFGEEPLTESTVRRLGHALAVELAARAAGQPRVLLGGDTRQSTPQLLAWLTAGLGAGGGRPIGVGVLPTAAIAWLVPRERAAAGVVVSASHNPAPDNGIKLVAADGFKWAPGDEHHLEQRLAATPDPGPGAAGGERLAGAAVDYLRWLAHEAGGARRLDGLRIALDAANGAASRLAGDLFRALGARVDLYFAAPDGLNINHECGSTHPRALAERIAAGGYDLGFAFDGDADRALMFDERGRLVDGDAMLFLWARDLRDRGHLAVPRVVATSMSNLGLERALEPLGIGVIRCGVGDREVVATLRREGLRLGGEPSGHLVDLHRTTTGDGLLTAAILAGIVARSALPASRCVAPFERFPQVLTSVRVAAKPDLATVPRVADAVRDVETRLGRSGRLVLRYSGTEPLARIMIEGQDEAEIEALAESLAAVLREQIGVAE